MDEASNQIVVSLRNLEAPESLYTLLDEMGVISIERISDQLAMTGSPDKGYPLSTSGLYPGFKVRFGSKNEAQKAKACAQGIALKLKSFSPENSLFIFNTPQDEDQHPCFNIGNGAFYALVFSMANKHVAIYKKFAEFGSISLLYPNKSNGGWIIHFDDEHQAEEARSKTLKVYEQ